MFFFCFLSFFLVAQWEKHYYCKKKKSICISTAEILIVNFVCFFCSCSGSVVNYSCWLYFCHFVSFVAFVTFFVSFVSLYSILFCYPFLLSWLLLLFSLSLLCGMLQPPVAIFFNLLENVGEGRVKRKRKIRWDEKKDPPLGGVVAGSRERKWGLAVKGKGGQSSSQSSSSFLSPPSDEVVKFAAAPAASKSRFDKHLFSGPIIFFPFLFLTWVASLYFCVVPSNRDVSSERKGRKNDKNKKKNPKKFKADKEEPAAIWGVGGWKKREKRLSCASGYFPCFDTSSSRIRSVGLLYGKRCRPPLTLFKGLLSTFVCNGQPSRVLRLQSARQLCCWQRPQAISPPPVLGFLPFFYFFTSWSLTAPFFFSLLSHLELECNTEPADKSAQQWDL